MIKLFKAWTLVLLALTAQTAFAASVATGEPLKLIARVDHLDGLAREPMVVQHPTGPVFVTGFGSQVTGTDWTAPPPRWRRDDEGETWSRVFVGSTDQGARGNSDVDLAVGPDGTLYFFAMGFNRETRSGTHVTMGVSRNVGASWQWHELSSTPMDDRPWVATTPTGQVHAIWNDGKGVRHSLSTNDGRSWKEQPRISPTGGSSHLATGPAGEVAVRLTPVSASGNQVDAETNAVAISTDAGSTWVITAAPGNAPWTADSETSVPRWVEPLAWGPAQTLYAFWSEGKTVKLGWTQDLGKSWVSTVIAEEPGVAFFPYLQSDLKGQLAATWFVRTGQSLTAQLAHIDVRGSAPIVRRAAPFTPLSWTEDPTEPLPDPAGEYVPVLLMDNNRLAVVTPVQDRKNHRWGFTWWLFSY